jgi:UDP:flavonoid glycosyltransferase YjiC (YdhE family)
MSRRFLFVALPLTGHVNPMAAVAHALTRRGNDVAWVGSEAFLRPLLGAPGRIFPVRLRLHRGRGDRGMTSVRSRWAGYVVPHARYTLPALDAAIAEFAPDVLVVDQHAVAGAVAAHRHRLPWASATPSAIELHRPYLALPKVEGWILGQLAGLWSAAGMPGAPPHDLRFSPHLTLAFTSELLTGELDVPSPVEFVGAVLSQRPAGDTFDWGWLDPARRHVLITMGTIAVDLAPRFFQRMCEAVRPLGDRLQAIMIAPEGVVADPPPHLRVVSRAPVLELMPRMDAVVGHGGLNTVAEALAHAVPLVVAPINGDQPVNAAQLVAAGAGIRARFDRDRPEQLRAALLAVLDDPSYRAAAARVRASFLAAGGAPAAAVHLEDLAGRAARAPSLLASHNGSERST